MFPQMVVGGSGEFRGNLRQVTEPAVQAAMPPHKMSVCADKTAAGSILRTGVRRLTVAELRVGPGQAIQRAAITKWGGKLSWFPGKTAGI